MTGATASLVGTKPAILVTGAAAGIGRAFARIVAGEGLALLLVDRSHEELDALATELATAGVEAHALTLDLTLPDAGDRVEAALAAHGLHCEILVNNAGLSLVGRAVEIEPVRQLRLVDLHVVALTDLTLRFLPGMIARRRGGILNVSSMGAYGAGPNMAIYNATKRYVSVFTATLRRECAGTGVRICSLVPGKARTGMWPADTESGHGLIFLLPMIGAHETAAVGWNGFRRGKGVVFPQLFFRLAALVLRILPARFHLLLTAGMFGTANGAQPDSKALKPAIVVTGASSRLGSAFAQLAAERKGHVVLVGRSADRLEELAKTLAARGAPTSAVFVDLARRDAGESVEQALRERGLYCDVLVNCAQPRLSGQAHDLGREAQLDLTAVNVRALTDLVLRMLPGMVARRRGGVLLLGAKTGWTSPMVRQSGEAAYQATRAYATWLGDALSCEIRGSGVTISLCTTTSDVDATDVAHRAWQRLLEAP